MPSSFTAELARRVVSYPFARLQRPSLPFSIRESEHLSSVAVSKPPKSMIHVSRDLISPVSDATGVSHLLSDQEISSVVNKALVWSSLNGLVMGDRSAEDFNSVPGVHLVHAPITLTPTSFPRKLFSQAVELAPLFNRLTDAVSQDTEFLHQTLQRAAETDSFTANLLRIHSTILSEGINQDCRLAMHRSDYMVDTITGKLLQIELNTISTSFPGLSTQVSALHRYILDQIDHDFGLSSATWRDSLPENTAADDMVEALAAAWKEYGDELASVLMIVQDPESNMYDQFWLSLKLWTNHRVPLIRKTLAQIEAESHLSPDGSLLIGPDRISVVYFRAGYDPADYPTQIEWDARLLLERSSAIKCPTVSYHLAGAKKVQQELAKPGILERFVPDKEESAKIRESFAGLWSLDEPESKEAIDSAMLAPENYVLKPQREGGGNNVYGLDVKSTIQKLSNEEDGRGLSAYILMQRIFPAINSSLLIRRGTWMRDNTLSELGIYSTYLRNKDTVILDKPAGHLLRTKTSTSNEGGVATGYAVLDSPYLI